MAFLETGWGKVSTNLNQPIVTLDNAVVVGAPTFYAYQSATDDLATIGANNYFSSKVNELSAGDVIFCVGSDGYVFRDVTLVTVAQPPLVNTSALSAAGAVGTGNIDALAVTTAKIADDAVTSAKVDPTLIQYVAVPMTTAQVKGMYAVPYLLVAAAGANTEIVLHRSEVVFDYVAAQYLAGGPVAIQLDSTANGAGILMSSVISAATINGFAADSSVGVAGLSPGATLAAKENKGLYISNTTGAFTTGDGVFIVHVWYSIIPTV